MLCPECGNYAENKALRKLGINEEKNVFTFDGNTEGKTQLTGTSMYKVSNKTPDINTLKLIRGVMGGVNVEAVASDCTVEAGMLIVATALGVALAAVIPETDTTNEPGVYVFRGETDYISYIEFAETIHPIDQKYLPGVCLPVVEIADISRLTESENSAVSACIGMPCILKTQYGTALCSYSFTSNVHMFFGMYAGEACVLVSADGATWHDSME